MPDMEFPEFPGPSGQEWMSSFQRRLKRDWERTLRRQLDAINNSGGFAEIFVQRTNFDISNVEGLIQGEPVEVPCEALPPECTCYQGEVVYTYDLRVQFDIFLNERISEATSTALARYRITSLGFGTWTFGVEEEVRKYRFHDCQGIFEVPEIPDDYVSVPIEEAFLALATHRPDAHFVIPGRPVNVSLTQFVPTEVKVQFEKGDDRASVEVSEQRQEVIRYGDLMSKPAHRRFVKSIMPHVNEWLTSASRSDQQRLIDSCQKC